MSKRRRFEQKILAIMDAAVACAEPNCWPRFRYHCKYSGHVNGHAGTQEAFEEKIGCEIDEWFEKEFDAGVDAELGL